MTMEPTTSSIPSLSEEETKARNKMSVIIGLILFGLVVSFYVVTLVRLQSNVAKKLVLDKEAAAVASKVGVTPLGNKVVTGTKGQAH